MNRVVEILWQKIVPLIEDLGYEVVEVEYKQKGDDRHITFFIHKKGGVTLDDCERVTKAIDAPLDELNPTGDESYILNVSSPGLDRPIVTDDDYRRNIGEDIELSLYKQVDKKKTYHGILIGCGDNGVTLLIDGKEKHFTRELIAKAAPYIDFNQKTEDLILLEEEN